MLLIAVTLMAIISSVPASFAGSMSNDETPVYVVPQTVIEWQAAHPHQKLDATFIPPLISSRPEKVWIFSECASSSSYVGYSRTNLMALLSGLTVNMDRTYDPSAAYLVPTDAWQLYDSATLTSIDFWDGVVSPADSRIANEHGSRMVFARIMKNDVHKYWVRVTSSSTNVGSSMTAVATNSAGAERQFNQNYLAINFGQNHVLESFPDPATKQWVQGGDDIVLEHGELPSLTNYDVVIDFGSSEIITTADTTGLAGIKAEFASSYQWVKAELLYIDAGVTNVTDSYYVGEAIPSLVIDHSGKTNVVLKVTGGQKMLVYVGQTSPTIRPPAWSLLHQDTFATGRSWIEPATDLERYYRLYGATAAPLYNPPPQ